MRKKKSVEFAWRDWSITNSFIVTEGNKTKRGPKSV